MLLLATPGQLRHKDDMNICHARRSRLTGISDKTEERAMTRAVCGLSCRNLLRGGAAALAPAVVLGGLLAGTLVNA